jgi:hypothetical protein
MRKERRNMKALGYYMALSAIVGFLFVPVQGGIETHPLKKQSFLTGQPHPALVGIDELRAVLLRTDVGPSADALDWTQLKADVVDKLNQAHIKLIAAPTEGIPSVPELRIYIDLLKLGNTPQYAFRIQTSVARSVCLKTQEKPVFKADLWKLNPVFEVVSIDDMSARLTDVVLGQINVFIRAYRVANPQGQFLTDSEKSETGSVTPSQYPAGTNAGSPTTKRGYVASSNSDIFHKPDCRWAKNISPENLTTYQSREQAIKAGKRPCKWCKP